MPPKKKAAAGKKKELVIPSKPEINKMNKADVIAHLVSRNQTPTGKILTRG